MTVSPSLLLDRDKLSMSVRLDELALSYLRRPWYAADGQPEKGSAHNEQLQALLQYVLYQLRDENVTAKLSRTGIFENSKVTRNRIFKFFYPILLEIFSSVSIRHNLIVYSAVFIFSIFLIL